VLLQRPFQFTLANAFKLYAGMFDQIPSWLRDLQGMLPADPAQRRPTLTEEDVAAHLAEVILAVAECWIAKVDSSRADERIVQDFASEWPSCESVLAAVRARLAGVEGARQRAAAQQLLKEVRRLEASGRRVSARCIPQPAAPPPLPAMPLLVPSLPELA